MPILPIFVTQSLHRPTEDVGFLFACYAGGLLVATPFFGWLADKYGRRWPMLGGLAGMVLATMAFAFAQTYWQLIVARIAQGISGSASWVVGSVFVSFSLLLKLKV